MSENKFTLHADMSDYPDKVNAAFNKFDSAPQYDSKLISDVSPNVSDESVFLNPIAAQPLTNLHEIPPYIPPAEALLSQEFALKSQRFSVSVFNSLDTWPADEPAYESFAFDPIDAYGFKAMDVISKLSHNQSSFVGSRNRGFIAFQKEFLPEKVSDANRNKVDPWINNSLEKSLSPENRASLWSLVEETAKSDEIQTRFPGLDLKTLTPFQATYISYSILKNNFKYDHTAITDGINRLTGTDLATAQELLNISQAAYEAHVKKRSNYLDNLSVVELLKEGKGVCRHAALISTVLYEVIKSKQDSVLLNGTYMLYIGSDSDVYATGSKEGRRYNEISNHAFNALVRLHPNDATDINIDLSILDPTFALKGEDINDLDYTGERMTTSIGVLNKLSKKFGIPSEQLTAILDDYFTRVPEVPNDFVAFSDYFGAKLAQEIVSQGHIETSDVLDTLDTMLDNLPPRNLLIAFNHIHRIQYFTDNASDVFSTVNASTADVLYKKLNEKNALIYLGHGALANDACANIERDFIRFPKIEGVAKVAVDMVIGGRPLIHTPFIAKLAELAEDYYDSSNPYHDIEKSRLADVNIAGLLARASQEIANFKALKTMQEDEFAYRYQMLQLAAANLQGDDHTLFVEATIKSWVTKDNEAHMRDLLSKLNLPITI